MVKKGNVELEFTRPGDKVTNKQAEKTQSWQTRYFLRIENDDSTDFILAKNLFALIDK